MSRLLALGIFGAVLGSQAPLQAQVTATAPQPAPTGHAQRWDFFGGAYYAHFNPSQGEAVHANNLLGWEGSATVWFRPIWGIEVNARGGYGNMSLPPTTVSGIQIPTTPPMSEHMILFGPSFRFYRGPKITLGMHYLLGAAYGQFSSGFPAGIQPQAVGVYNDKLAVGQAIGGWADRSLSPHWALRFVADWQPTHYGFTFQNEFAGAAGVVYKFGSMRR